MAINLATVILLGSFIAYYRAEKDEKRRIAQKVAGELGLELAPDNNDLTGIYKTRKLLLRLDRVRDRRSAVYRGVIQLNVDTPAQVELTIQEKTRISKLMLSPTAIAKQTGANLVNERFTIKSIPPEIAKNLLDSLDFCYGILLLPQSVITLQQGKIICQFDSLTIESILFPAILSTLDEVARISEAVAQ